MHKDQTLHIQLNEGDTEVWSFLITLSSTKMCYIKQE